MTNHEQVIAWLVPTARGSHADKATNMSENSFRSTPIDDSSFFLTARLPNLIASRPSKAIQLAFDQAPKRPGSFILGADPRNCDIVLPSLPGISAQHCSFHFDSESRLVLEDFSECGTQVWYDWESCGDRTDYTWVLNRPPGTAQRITVDIQGIRFQVILNEHHENDREAYVEKVEAFCEQPSWAEGLSCGWDRVSLPPVAPLFDAAPIFQHILVKSFGEQGAVGEMYLWNMARPWEPMVKAEVAAA